MEVREGMSSVILAVGPGHTLREAATKMTEKGTGAALVFDERVAGAADHHRARRAERDRQRRSTRTRPPSPIT